MSSQLCGYCWRDGPDIVLELHGGHIERCRSDSTPIQLGGVLNIRLAPTIQVKLGIERGDIMTNFKFRVIRNPKDGVDG